MIESKIEADWINDDEFDDDDEDDEFGERIKIKKRNPRTIREKGFFGSWGYGAT